MNTNNVERALSSCEQINPGDVVIQGICSDYNSSHLTGAAQAPDFIRKTLFEGSANKCTETGIDLKFDPRLRDLGDITAQQNATFLAIEQRIDDIIQRQAKPMIWGGDHAITYPIVKAVAKAHKSLTILHFDAHPDLYDNFQNNLFSHASPFARIMEQGLVKRLVQVGIRTITPHLKQQIERFGVEVHEMRFFDINKININENVYVSVDLDGLDPAFAPGVSHIEPGGLSTREVLNIIHNIRSEVVGADIVELNPTKDINNMTAAVAAKLSKELIGLMLSRSV